MRLICPNCDAQYEVSEDAIPETGRDVQCSACGHTWFQAAQAAPVVAVEVTPVAEPAMPPPTDAVPDVVADLPASPPSEAEDSTDAEIVAAMGAALAAFDPPLPEEDAAPEQDDLPEAEPEPEPEPEPAVALPAARPAPAARSMDESLMAVLREEAERETRARAHEEPAIEIQQDLGLETAAATVMPRRVVPFDRAATAGAETETHVRPPKGRELLPDIEEINSTLSPMTDLASEDPQRAAMKPRPGNFGRGFMLAILIGMIALTVYVTAPRLVQRFPAAEGPVMAYVQGVNRLRLKLDGVMASAVSALQD